MHELFCSLSFSDTPLKRFEGMDITAENFRVYLPVMKEQLAGAAFVAIDEEMTGITDRQNRITANDTPSERYRKMVFGALI